MVNAPTIFSVAWAAILPFANDYVRAKLHLSRHAETELLSEICGPHGVPRSLGGTYEPPPDDAVTEEAPQGADGPESARDDAYAWSTVSIEAGKLHKVVVDVPAPSAAEGTEGHTGVNLLCECELKASGVANGGDVSFYVVHQPPGTPSSRGDGAYAIEPCSLCASDGAVARVLEAPAPGRYTCIWDNSTAWYYARELSYRVVTSDDLSAVTDRLIPLEADGRPTVRQWAGLGVDEIRRLSAD